MITTAEKIDVATALEISNLSFSYPDGWQALNGVTFSLRAGEKVAILGPNGAGKSTLLLHLNGLLHGTGDVSVMGHRVIENDKKSLGQVRSLVGLVFQDPDDQLFSPTVYDDVAFGPTYMGLPRDEIDDRVLHALSLVGLENYGDRMPFHLSGGEKKRAAIATVLSMNPQVLVLDEPSAGLDPRARRGLINLLDQLEQTILITTHDMHMVKEIFSRSIIMDGGVVVADAPTQEILSDQILLESHGLELP